MKGITKTENINGCNWVKYLLHVVTYIVPVIAWLLVVYFPEGKAVRLQKGKSKSDD